MTNQKKQKRPVRQVKDDSFQPKKKRRKPATKKKSATNSAGVSKKRQTQQKKRRKQKKIKRMMTELILTVLISSMLLLLISFLTISLPRVEGYSMMPTLEDQDRVFVNKLGKLKRFKLVYYKDPKSQATTIRRIIGTPKESLYYKEDRLFINDQEVVERFIADQIAKIKQSNSVFTKDFSLSKDMGDDQIPAGKYVVLGDNRSYAADSRMFGYIDEKDIIGVVEARIFPIHRMTRF